MSEFVENLILEGPKGKIEVTPLDWICGAVFAGVTLFGVYKISQMVRGVKVDKETVSVEMKEHIDNMLHPQ